MVYNYDAMVGFSDGSLKGVKLKGGHIKYRNLFNTSVGINNLCVFDTQNTIIGSEKCILIFNIPHQKVVKSFSIHGDGNFIGLFKKDFCLYVGADTGMVVVKPIRNSKILDSKKIKTGSNLTCLRQCLTLDKYVTGGNQIPLKIWDIETGRVEFIAKSAEPDTFQLPQQSHVSDIRFLNNKVFVSYKHGVVDIHDPLSGQGRPVGSFNAANIGFDCMQTIPGFSDYDVIVGSSAGSIFHYDLRGKLEYPVKTLEGCTGSINAVSCINYLNEMHLMSLSLDCNIAIHNFSSGELSHMSYTLSEPMSIMTNLQDS